MREAAAPARAARLLGLCGGRGGSEAAAEAAEPAKGEGRKTDSFNCNRRLRSHINPRTLLANPPLGECNLELPPLKSRAWQNKTSGEFGVGGRGPRGLGARGYVST